MDDVISNIKKSDYNFLKKTLIKMGYVDSKNIIDDEIQAYLSTGLIDKMKTRDLKKYQNNFVSIYNRYRK
jgi:hypothetical protein